MYRYFKIVAGFGSDNYIYFWKSDKKRLSDESITAPTTSDYSLNLKYKLFWYLNKSRIQRELFKAR